MQVVIYNWPLSKSNLLYTGWPGWHRSSSLKRQHWGVEEVQCQVWNCLFNVYKTMSLYFFLIKTAKFCLKYMEFTNNYN